jgi:hypothetical protein
MKKIILFSAVACSMAFYACKKDSKTDTATPTTEEPSTSIDPVALSAAVKIGYATSATGDIPAATADGPTLLKDGYDNRTYYAISNRYVVIYPQSDKGFVAGYYVKINGAQTYFKVDYKAAAGARKLNKSNGFREEGDNSDSSIVIKLPDGLKGDTFSVKYAAYDTLNHVSNTITAIVSIIASADSTDNSLLYGTWRYNRNKRNHDEWSEPQSYKIDTSYEQMSCIEDHIQWCTEGYTCEPYIYHIYGYVKNDQTFGANNTYTSIYQYESKYLNMETSSCSDLKYNNNGYTGSDISGYSYNSKTKVLTIIYDGNDSNDYGSNIYTDQYTVTEITSTKLVYYYRSEYNDTRIGARDNEVVIRYYEFLKQ